MKRFLRTRQTIFAVLLFLGSFSSYASDPTTSASNVQFASSKIDGARFTVNFSGGNGTGGRIVVVKEGSDIIGVPVDGTRYTYNTAFGTAGTEFTAPGEYVVAQTINMAASITVTNLKPGTTYYVAIFELNGSYNDPASIDYSVVTPRDKSVTTVSAPTAQASITGFTQVAGSSVRINWANGNGQGRLVVAAKGTTLTATPADLTSYNYSKDFGSTTSSSYWLSPEVFAVYESSTSYTTYADISNLEPNTSYTFAVFEFNGDYTPVYLTPATTQTVTTNAGPTQAPTSISFSKIDGDRLNFTWSRGNGTQSLVVVKKGSAVTHVPVNGTSYTSSAVFGTPAAEWFVGSGEYVVSSGTNNSVVLTGLEKSTTYFISVFASDVDKNGYPYYLTTPYSKSQSTAMPPTAQTTITVSNITGSSAQLTYHAPASGGGSYRLLVIRDGAPVEFLPEDLVAYTGGTPVFGKGQLVGTDTYTLYGQSNGGAPNVTGLTPGHTYYATVFEMNGSLAPVYLRPGSSVRIDVPNEPTTAAYNPGFSYVEGNSIRFSWTNGDGARRIVVAREGSDVTSVPQDGSTYTASGKLGSGSELTPGSGEFVVYDGSANFITVTGLEKATTYHFAVFEYNSSASGPDYLTSAGKWLAASHATAGPPSSGVSNLEAYSIGSNLASFRFTPGDGSSRIFVMREGAPVDAEPQDYSKYTMNGKFGTSGSQLGTGNYVVYSGDATFSVTELKPGTQYYITAFEYNGSSAPVYLRPGATMYSFSTTGGVVITAPTQAATAPLTDKLDGSSFTLKWTNGDGANRIVIARKAMPVSFVPADGTDYTASAAFGSNTDLGDGQYVVFNGSGNVLNLANLEPATTYHFAVYEYNGSAGTTKYGAASLATSGSTAAAPAVISSNPSSTTTVNSITLHWTAGNGNGRIVVAREGSAVTAEPTNLNKYSSNSVFKNGPQLALGQYVVYAGSGNSVTVSGLEANKTYHFSIFEYNGAEAPVYNTTDVLKTSGAISSTLPVTWISFTAIEKNGSIVLEWITAGEINAQSYVVERSSDGVHFSAVASLPATGGEGPNTYSVTDQAQECAAVYYRVKQLDVDGKFSYSSVLKVAAHGTGAIRLLQNPVHDELGFTCSGEWTGGSFAITDAGGRIISTGRVNTTINRIALPVAGSGIWHITVYHRITGKSATLAFLRN